MKHLVTGLLFAAILCTCAPPPQSTTTASDDEWMDLLSEEHANAWRGYNAEELPPGWTIADGELYFDTEVELEQDYTGGRDILYGAREFDNFELEVEWKIPPGGNSGIFYHVKEGYGAPSEVAPEYQLIDDEGYAEIHDLSGYNRQFGAENPAELQDWQRTGADYAMTVPDDSKKQLNPAGEWNRSRIVYTPDRVEHWLNGQKLLEFDPGSDDWRQKRDSGKWKNMPDYGKFESGYIALQDHGSPLWFRNIRIRPL